MPPEFPLKKTSTSSTKGTFTIGGGIPIVHHLSSAAIEKLGWMAFDKGVWLKNGYKIKYDGEKWRIGGAEVKFIEDLPKDLNDKK